MKLCKRCVASTSVSTAEIDRLDKRLHELNRFDLTWDSKLKQRQHQFVRALRIEAAKMKKEQFQRNQRQMIEIKATVEEVVSEMVDVVEFNEIVDEFADSGN